MKRIILLFKSLLYYRWYLLIPFGILPLILLFLTASTNNDIEKRQEEFNNRYGIYALDIPPNLNFAGVRIPIDIPDVRERLDRELLVNTYWQSQTLLFLKRKERYFPVIEPILKRNNIPDDFKFLAMAESGLTNTVSPSGAAGFWQFLEGTGKSYGLEINSEVDERYNLEKATQAACDYFLKSYAIYKDWCMVAASYNMGVDGLMKLSEKQNEKDYFELLLVEETSRYLFRITALKEICNDPLRYGFHLRKRDFYEPYPFKVVTVDSQVTDLSNFAEYFDINYKELKLLNPWLRQPFLTNRERRSYNIKIVNKSIRNPSGTVLPSDTSWIKMLPGKQMHQE